MTALLLFWNLENHDEYLKAGAYGIFVFKAGVVGVAVPNGLENGCFALG